MYALIDSTNYRPIATSEHYGCLTGLAYIQFANVDTVVLPINENKHFAQFTLKQLESIIDAALTGFSPVSGKGPNAFKTGPYEYKDAIAKCRASLEASPQLRFPFSLEKVEEQAACIDEEDDKPYTFNPDGRKPIKAKKWTFDPQKNRSRNTPGEGMQFRPQATGPAPDTKAVPSIGSFATMKHVMTEKANGVSYEDFVAQGWTDDLMIEHGYMEKPKPVAPPPPPKKGAPPPPPASRVPPRPGAAPAAKEPRAPRAERAPGPGGLPTRPNAESKTGRVWVIADSISAKSKLAGKDLRSAVIDACKSEGINPSTASVQYGNWSKHQK